MPSLSSGRILSCGNYANMSSRDSLYRFFIESFEIPGQLPNSTNYSGQHLLTCDSNVNISYGGIKSIRYSGINLHIFIILIKNILKNLHIYVMVE